MNRKGIVNKIIPFSNVDGPGNRLAIFFQGCNIKCIYCHNPETINICNNCMTCTAYCPSSAITNLENRISYNEKLCQSCDNCIKVCKRNSSPRAIEYSVDELVKIIEDYKPFIRGITVSGGEPTLQAKFIEELFKAVKAMGLSCFVDTNGFFDRDEIKPLINIADKFMVDIKAVTGLEKLCSTDFNNNLDNLKYLLSMEKVYEVRTVVILDYMDPVETIEKVGNILKEYPDVNYKLIRVHSTGLTQSQKDLIEKYIPNSEYMNVLKQILIEKGLKNIEIIF